MIKSTLPRLHCPACRGSLDLYSTRNIVLPDNQIEVASGHLSCKKCQENYPIVEGVAILVRDVPSYFYHHVKGISQFVEDVEIPQVYRDIFKEAKDEWLSADSEHIEEDLESQRVNALYLMTHYLHANQMKSDSPLIQDLIKTHWDQGPFSKIKQWVDSSMSAVNMVELGCGVGGLCAALKPKIKSYLGVDSSFASVAFARQINLGISSKKIKIQVPDDLLRGPLAREIVLEPQQVSGADFVVGDLQDLPVVPGQWDLSVALNAIDMLDEPENLPKLQHALVKKTGFAIQSCPYVWHQNPAKRLRGLLPKDKSADSALAIEWLYEKAGFKLSEKAKHVPWLFFKHERQLEIYSVHLFLAQKN